MAQSIVERILARDRMIVIASLVLCVGLSAWYILEGAGTGMSSMEMSLETGPGGALLAGTDDFISPHVWTIRYAVIVFVMWWLMMVAMMVPSAIFRWPMMPTCPLNMQFFPILVEPATTPPAA